MAEQTAIRLPLAWHAGDPEPDIRVSEVRTGYGETWTRVRPHPDSPDYRWWNGDKIRTWNMLTNNRGPLYNTVRLRRLHNAYGRRRRG